MTRSRLLAFTGALIALGLGLGLWLSHRPGRDGEGRTPAELPRTEPAGSLDAHPEAEAREPSIRTSAFAPQSPREDSVARLTGRFSCWEPRGTTSIVVTAFHLGDGPLASYELDEAMAEARQASQQEPGVSAEVRWDEPWSVSVPAEGVYLLQVEVDGGPTIVEEWRIDAGHTVKDIIVPAKLEACVEVVGQGAPIPEASVTLVSREPVHRIETTTDSRGRASIAPVQDATYAVYITTKDRSWASDFARPEQFRFASGQEVVKLQAYSYRTVTFEVTVDGSLASAGLIIGDALPGSLPTAGPPRKLLSTEGQATLETLGIPRRFFAVVPGSLVGSAEWDGASEAIHFRLSKGTMVTGHVDKLPADGIKVTARLVAPEGLSLVSRWCDLREHAQDIMLTSGEFALGPLCPGEWALSWTWSGQKVETALTVSGSEMRIDLDG